MGTERPLAYWPAKVGKWAQRVVLQVGAGCLLIIGSHWWPDPGEREWLRDVGAVVVGFSSARWMNQQGQRRRHRRTGQAIRTPTLRISAEDAQRYRTRSERNGDET